MTLRIVDVTDATGRIVEPGWLLSGEAVHRQLRPQMPTDYLAKIEAVCGEGGRVCVAVASSEVVGVAVYRMYENTFEGRQMYVDDLVTDQANRSTGVGKALLDHMQEIASNAGCVAFNLDSGVQRAQAHKFYFREGMVASAFHFAKPVRMRSGN